MVKRLILVCLLAIPAVAETLVMGNVTNAVWTWNGTRFISSWETATAWSPLSLSGCDVWLDGKDEATITENEYGAASTWLDKSGNNNDFALFAPEAPTLPFPVKVTDGIYSAQTNGLYSATYIFGTAFTWFLVLNETQLTEASVAYVFGRANVSFPKADAGNAMVLQGSAPNMQFVYGGAGTTTNYSGFGSIKVFTFVGTNLLTRAVGINNGGMTTATPLSASVNPGNIGCSLGATIRRSIDGAQYTQGKSKITFHEVICYNRVLSDEEITAVKSYLFSRWGISP